MKFLRSIPMLTILVIIGAGLMAVTLHFATNLEVPLLLFLANLTCLFLPLTIVAYLAAGAYLAGSPISLLLVGCSALFFGFTSLIAGFFGLAGNFNGTVTLHNSGALAAGVFMAAAFISYAGSPSSKPATGREKWIVIASYCSIIVSTGLLTVATMQGLLPAFMIPGQSSPLVRQVVLGSAILLFGVSTALALYANVRKKLDFTYWYSLGLVLITTGLCCVFFQPSVGSLLGWTGRFGQYAGSLYLLVAVFIAHRLAKATQQPWGEVIIGFFKDENPLQLQKEFAASRHITAIVIVFGAVVLCAMWTGLYYKAQSEREVEVSHAVQLTTNYVRTFEEQTERTIRGLDQIALFLKYQVEKDGWNIDIPKFVAEGRFAGQPYVLLSVDDENGDVIASSQVPFATSNIKDREHFLVHRDVDDGKVFISKPLVGRVSGKASIQLTRRINKADGSFGGIAVVSVDPYYFGEFYKQVNLGEKSSIALIGVDGIVRVRQSGSEIQTGLDLGPRMTKEFLSSVAGHYTAKGIADGQNRLYSYRFLQDYPLIVSIGMSEKEILKDVDRRIINYYSICAVMSLLIILFVATLLYSFARRRWADARLLEALVKLERFREALDEVPAYIYIKDTQSRYIYANKLTLGLFGCSAEVLYGSTDADFFQPDTAIRIQENELKVLLGQKITEEISAAVRGKEQTVFLDTKTPIFGTDGKIDGMLGVSIDITERKNTEARMHQLERLSSLGGLAAGVVHEISQPLQALKVTVDGALYWHEQGKTVEPEKMLETCRRASMQANRIAEILKRLRSFISQSKSDVMYKVDLNDATILAVDVLRQRLEAHGIDLREQLSPDLPIIWGSSGRIGEAIVNLVVNAIQALEKVNKPDKEVVITTQHQGEKAVLEIYNNGPKIPEDVIDKIFDPLFSTRENTENMGLGLSIVQSIVAVHDGRITVNNRDEGVSFRVEFPRYEG